jgi:acyl-homoserine lactone acylase PvdQ
MRAAAQSPFTFNVAYADSRDIAMYSAGRFPLRAPGVDPGLPTDGRGSHEWRGFLAAGRHPHVVNPRNGSLVNWNNKPARDFPAADDQWTYGSIYRSQMLQAGIDARRKHTLASVVSAMNRAATTDLRVFRAWPTIAAVLQQGGLAPPSPRAGRMFQLLNDYRAAGASRLDRDLDGKVDGAGAAIIDAAWPRLADAVLSPVLGPQLDDLDALVGRRGGTESDFTGGRSWYVDKDLRTLLGRPVRGRYANRYCGAGDPAACRASLWAAIEAAGDELAASQGPNPDAWRADAAAERIGFTPGVLPTKIRYTNRPSGIQQVLFFKGHRPRR